MLLVRLFVFFSACLISVSVSSPASSPGQSNPPRHSSSTTLSQHLNISPTRQTPNHPIDVKEHVQALRDTRKSLKKHERGWTHRTDFANVSQAFCCFGTRENQRKKANDHHIAIQQKKESLEGLVNQNVEAGSSSPKTSQKLEYEMKKAKKKLSRFPKQEKHRETTNQAHDDQQYIIDHRISGGSSSDGEDILFS